MEAIDYIRRTGKPVKDPTVLQIPELIPGNGPSTIASRLASALVAGDEATSRRLLYSQFLQQSEGASLADDVISAATRQIKSALGRGDIELYLERRAIRMISQILVELRSRLRPITGPMSCGTTPLGEYDGLSSDLVEFSLRCANWNAWSLGSSLTAATAMASIKDIRPALYWLCVDESVMDRTTTEMIRLLIAAMQHSGGEFVVISQNPKVKLSQWENQARCFRDTRSLVEFVKQLGNSTP